ncbi:PREDICTED: uncharacterized protein LOC104709876 [Camelina sativa]|uniref:Uncharacterized protein LOC104709876 n=1 Tax=Camelina sativa TaxID=90675 RepID=A0ABM0TDG6_CAMSA|nr:PREDICTED: uncharacterized protein LOC104709876 [Camelina sativa]
MMVLEDYEIQSLNMVDVEFSYLPFDLSVDSPPVVMMNDRQVKNFVAYWRMKNNIRLCVTFKTTVNDRSNIDLNKEPSDSSEGGVDSLHREKQQKIVSKAKPNDCNFITSKDAEVGARSMMVDSMVKKGQYFKSKEALQASLEIFAMKYNFDYRVTKSGTRLWCIRCIDNVCKWCVRAECLEGSTCWKINKYVGSHTCAPSRKTKFGRTPSARTIGNLIKHNYEGVKEGPKPNDIINIMRTENGCELTYSQAWESREYAVNEVRGIPEKSFAKIPNYLHMLKEANPGTHTNYDIDCDGRFKYLFISFGQSIRGFYKKIRKVIVVDGTFLKNKYKGVLLVATAVDGNSNLYPIAFGIADSENDASWEWFLMQLKVVIADDKDLAFVSDRHISIGKMIGKIYPLAKHGICIHHLIGNVVTNYKGRGVAGRLAKASKAYRVAEFDKHFAEICNISPAIGGYLQEADVKKWARCHFLGYRYDINTNNPAESINSALRSPREYPIIPLLDSIREMLTRWFYERRAQSEQQNDPLTIDVEQKISRRIEKGEKFKAYPISQFILQIKGKGVDFIVDLEKRTCSCGKFDTGKLPCRHAIKACFSIGKSLYPYADDVFTTAAWRSLYEETINPIGVPEDEWCVPETVGDVKIVPPETRRGAGRRRKRRYESVEDKIRLSQGAKRRKCGRCGKEGHNRSTCENTI